MVFKIAISRRAQIHIDETVGYYEEKQKGLGIRFYKDFKSNLTYLKINPDLFQVKNDNLRELRLSSFPYIIIYEILDNQIIILSVFNTSQNPEKKTGI